MSTVTIQASHAAEALLHSQLPCDWKFERLHAAIQSLPNVRSHRDNEAMIYRVDISETETAEFTVIEPEYDDPPSIIRRLEVRPIDDVPLYMDGCGYGSLLVAEFSGGYWMNSHSFLRSLGLSDAGADVLTDSEPSQDSLGAVK